MAKNVPRSKFTELKGLDRISQTVHGMGCLWREISKDDVGIDGEIEILTPKRDGKGFETTGAVIKVQAKSGASYILRDHTDDFAVRVKKEDLEYWKSCSFQVLIIVYHPKDDKLYCKEVKSYIQSTPDALRDCRVCFDKAHDEFGPSYRANFVEHAKVRPILAGDTASSCVRTNRVFICYRRDDSAYPSQVIYETLVSRFGEEAVFFDIDTIPPGHDFYGILNEAVAKCDLLLAVIGDQWVNAKDETGHRRLDNPNDFVRVEIEAAFSRNIPVIPVLVGRTAFLSARDLPPTLQALSRRQGIEVRAGRDFRGHLERLVQDVEQALAQQIHVGGMSEVTGAFFPNDSSSAALVFTQFLKHTHPEVRAAGVKGLALMGAEHIPALVDLLKDGDLVVRSTAVEALRHFGPVAEFAVEELLAKDESWVGRVNAIMVLEKGGPRAIPILMTSLRDKKPEVRAVAATALGKIGPEARMAIGAITELFQDDCSYARSAAARAVGEIGPEAIPLLTKLVQDGNGRVRRSAIEASGHVGPEASSIVPFLIKLIGRTDEETQDVIAGAVGKMGSASVHSLIELLKQNDRRVRHTAAESLGNIGPDAKLAVADLIELLSCKEDGWLRQCGADALGNIGAEARAAIPYLIELLKDEDEYMRGHAAEALGKIGPEAAIAIPIITDLVRHEEDEDVYEMVVEAWNKLTGWKPAPNTIEVWAE